MRTGEGVKKSNIMRLLFMDVPFPERARAMDARRRSLLFILYYSVLHDIVSTQLILQIGSIYNLRFFTEGK